MTPKEHVRVFSCIAEQWLLCLSPPSPGYRSILNMCNSLKWDSQFRLHSRLVKCELWFPLNPHFSAVSFTGPKVHWEGQLPTSGVLGDDHKFLLPCPAPLLLAVPQFCLNSGYSWYSTSLGMYVCVLWSRRKRNWRQGVVEGLPFPSSLVLSPFLHRSSTICVRRKVARVGLRGYRTSSLLSK